MSTRIHNVPRRCQRLLAKQFAAGANNFTLVDPTPDGTPLTLTSATGQSGFDGSVTLVFMTGFTAGVVITAFEWQQDLVTPSNSAWIRVAPSSTGTDIFSKAVDSHYCKIQFAIAEDTPFLIMSSAAITGLVYTDARINGANNNTAAGY